MGEGVGPFWNDSMVGQLRLLADRAMAQERADHTLQPTALVNEAYLILSKQGNLADCRKSSFLAAAARTIRRILVDHARRRNAQKRGGPDRQQISLHFATENDANSLDLLALHEALEALKEESERAAKVVEMRFFGGMSGQEIAETLDVSLRTVNNDWSFSKAWLYNRMKETG